MFPRYQMCVSIKYGLVENEPRFGVERFHEESISRCDAHVSWRRPHREEHMQTFCATCLRCRVKTRLRKFTRTEARSRQSRVGREWAGNGGSNRTRRASIAAHSVVLISLWYNVPPWYDVSSWAPSWSCSSGNRVSSSRRTVAFTLYPRIFQDRRRH